MGFADVLCEAALVGEWFLGVFGLVEGEEVLDDDLQLFEGAEGEIIADAESVVEEFDELLRVVFFVEYFLAEVGLFLFHV